MPSKSNTCIFKGSIIDSENGEPLIFASIILKDNNGKVITGGNADIDGNFTIRAPKGKYEVEFAYIGYATQRTTLNLNTDTLTIGAAVLQKTATVLGGIPVMIVGMPRTRIPLIDMGAPESGERIDADRISHFPQ